MTEIQIDKALRWMRTCGSDRVYYKYLGYKEYLYMFRNYEDRLVFWMFVVLSEEKK